MTPRSSIFISAAIQKLKSARQLVPKLPQFLGYETVWQELQHTETI
jgi:hypothetical protein